MKPVLTSRPLDDLGSPYSVALEYQNDAAALFTQVFGDAQDFSTVTSNSLHIDSPRTTPRRKQTGKKSKTSRKAKTKGSSSGTG
jgi:hypothetical protein